MTDEQQWEQETAEQTAIENPTQEVLEETQVQPSETETEALQETNDSEVPKDNAAWAAMRVENKRLKEQLKQPDVDEEYLHEAQQFANAQGGYYQPQTFDENTDINQVSYAINQANQAALQASQRVRQLEIALEEQEMFAKYPHFREDKLAQQLIAEKKLVSKTLGRERRYTDIAKEVDALIRRDREQVEAQVRDSERQQFTQKMAASTQTPSYPSQQSGDDKEALRERARRGDSKATAELLKDHLEGIDFNF